ncbi:MAG: thioredoxin-disulfide reductase [Actinomycetota bacterium]|nr:thioredoxin-disulfide reductase [Actinomycetota bacterium]
MNNSARKVVVIGGGPAGLTAGLYVKRAGIDALLLERELPGGQAVFSPLIENFPGFPDGIEGAELMTRIKKQAERFGLEIRTFAAVVRIEGKDRMRKIVLEGDEVGAIAVIVATGRSPRKLGIPGEDEFKGRGISYCATCDAPLFSGKEVLVVGGGDAALEEALHLSRFVRRVILVHRRDELRASSYLEGKARAEPKIEFVLNTELREIKGDQTVRSVVLENNKTGEVSEIEVSGVFFYVGNAPNTDFLKGLADLDDAGYILTDSSLQSSVRGIFAAGDVRANSFKQVILACAEGALAANSAMRYLEEVGEKKAYGSPRA